VLHHHGSQVGLPNWWEAGAQKYAINNTTLAVIEVVTFAVLEALRYDGWKRTGAVSDEQGGVPVWRWCKDYVHKD
jgi:hypothetical protein